MDRRQADHAGDFVGADPYGLAQHLAGVQAAHPAKAEQPLALVAGEHEAHLVHVGGDHHPQTVGSRAALHGQHIAQGVHPNLVGQGAHLLEDDAPHLGFVARDGHGFGQPGQQAHLARAEGGKGGISQANLLDDLWSASVETSAAFGHRIRLDHCVSNIVGRSAPYASTVCQIVLRQ